jgi:ABC-type multidrug transport system ATPase subunit
VKDYLNRLRLEIAGILVAPADYSYLKHFAAPAFSEDAFEFIPLKPGLNVIFGKNGAGKTSFLRIMENALAGRVSPFEGLVVKLPRDMSDNLKLKYQTISELMDGYMYRRTEGLHFSSAFGGASSGGEHWSFSESEKIIDEWAKESLALVTTRYENTVFKGENPALSISESEKIMHDFYYSSKNEYVELELVPLIRINEDTPETLESLRLLRHLFSVLFGTPSQKNIENLEHNFSQEELKTAASSPLANVRNFLGVTHDDSYQAKAGFYFLDAMRNTPVAHPHTSISNYEKYPGVFSFVSTIVDSFSIQNQGFQVPNSQELCKILWSKASREYEKRHLIEDLNEDQKLKWLREYANSEFVEKFRGELAKAFPKFRWANIGTPSNRGLLWGDEPMIYFGNGDSHKNCSESEDRWLRLGLTRQAVSPSVLLIDEPERGLDRNSLRIISKTLSSNWGKSSMIIATSHSPSILNINNSNPILIHERKMFPYSRELLNELGKWGISAVDLLELIRTFLFVEGEHEKIVIEHYYEDFIKEFGIKIIPVRGSTALKKISEWSLFLETTDCPIIAVMDNLDPHDVKLVFTNAVSIYKESNWEAAMDYVNSELVNDHNRGTEASDMVKLIGEAIKINNTRRFVPTAFPKKDILFYLEESLFGLEETWEELYRRFEVDKASGNPPKGDFKLWVKNKFRVDIQSANSIQQAIQSTNVNRPVKADLDKAIDSLKILIRENLSVSGVSTLGN